MSIQEYVFARFRSATGASGPRSWRGSLLPAGGFTMKRLLLMVLATVIGIASSVGAQSANDWPTVGNDPGGMKYSSLTQITPANVARLAKAWTYDTGAPATGYTITPIVINNVMYLPVRLGTTIVALKADT